MLKRQSTRSNGRCGDERGFSFLEAIVCTSLVLFATLGMTEMTGFGIALDKDAGNRIEATVLANDKMEELRAADYDGIAAGGSLDQDVPGFFDRIDIDGDGTDDHGRRWEVVDLDGMLRLRVGVNAFFGAAGNAQAARLVTLRARRLDP